MASHAARRRPPRTAAFAVAVGLIAVVAVLAAGWIGVRGVLAYGHLSAAQGAASLVGADLGDPAVAESAIAGIAAETSAARDLTSDPVWRAAESLPWVGPQLKAVSTVAASVDLVATTALSPLSELAGSFAADALLPVGGRIDLATLSSLQGAAATGAEGVASAKAQLDGLDRTALLGPIDRAVDEVAGLLAGADGVVRAATLLPAMLGAEGPRDYLVLFQNNAEWRSLGGIAGAVALLRTDGGAVSLATPESASGFPGYDPSVLPLGDEITGIYTERPGRWMHNVTQVPDFTVSATLAREMWARTHDGQQVDGVIALDPVSLSYMLRATGPVALPTGDVLTSENAVSLLLNEVYVRYSGPAEQDEFFASATAEVFDALVSGDVDPAGLVSALTQMGAERRLLIWSAHDDEQALLAETTLAGGLPVTDDETARFGVFLNDGTGSKMDFYATAASDVAWTACAATSAGVTGTAQLTVTVANNAPADAATSLPTYITGGGKLGVPPGNAKTVAYLYLPTGFELASASMDDDSGFGGGTHDGRRVVSFEVELAPGQSATATVRAEAVSPGAGRLEVVQTPGIQTAELPAASCR
ncbi:DUF4012 domain-containing protein [Microbacterium sp.]|uniref:DUF4012 domain-containing protein n=1 Tax=Microbacterium sp. TaxID=51671 RepID=UPI0025F330FC|nr:DUF4012 domain-containing protein [Microbacterium sp.]